MAVPHMSFILEASPIIYVAHEKKRETCILTVSIKRKPLLKARR